MTRIDHGEPSAYEGRFVEVLLVGGPLDGQTRALTRDAEGKPPPFLRLVRRVPGARRIMTTVTEAYQRTQSDRPGEHTWQYRPVGEIDETEE